MRFARDGAATVPLLLLALFSAAPAAAQGPPFGPLHFEEGGPLQRLSYTPMTEIADPVPAGRLQAGLWMGYSNIFDADSTATHDLYLDLERLVTAVSVRYGVTADLEAGVRITTETTGGGVLDSFLSRWHRFLHVGNADRALYPTNAYGQRLSGPHGTLLLNIPRRTMGLEDVRLFAKWKAWQARDGKSLVSLRAVGRIPSGQNRSEGQREDVALLALGRMSWTRWHLHGMVGGSTARVGPELRSLVRSSAWFATAGAERSLAPWVSAVVQYSLATPRLHGIGDPEVDGPAGNLVFGATGSAGRSWLWDVSFQEDIPPSSPAVDFTLGIQLSRRW